MCFLKMLQNVSGNPYNIYPLNGWFAWDWGIVCEYHMHVYILYGHLGPGPPQSLEPSIFKTLSHL